MTLKVPDLSGKASSLFSFCVVLAVCLLHMLLFVMQDLPPTISFLRFYLKMLYITKLSASNDIIMWFSFYVLLTWCIMFFWFIFVDHFWDPGTRLGNQLPTLRVRRGRHDRHHQSTPSWVQHRPRKARRQSMCAYCSCMLHACTMRLQSSNKYMHFKN